jgi:hypothetical protein
MRLDNDFHSLERRYEHPLGHQYSHPLEQRRGHQHYSQQVQPLHAASLLKSASSDRPYYMVVPTTQGQQHPSQQHQNYPYHSHQPREQQQYQHIFSYDLGAGMDVQRGDQYTTLDTIFSDDKFYLGLEP